MGNGVPTGSVTASADGSSPVTVPLDDTGTGTFTNSDPSAQTYNIVATYSGDTTYAPSTSSFTELVYGSPATVTVVSGDQGQGTYGTTFHAPNAYTPPYPAYPLTVLVRDANGDVVPNAVVTFGGTGLKYPATTVKTNANGVAEANPTAIAVGTLTATATVNGVTTPAKFTLTADPAALTVAAQNATVAYDQPIPKLTYTITGFVNGDKSSVVSGAPTETTTATDGSAAGTYPITINQGTLSATNYFFYFVNGTLTITAAK